MQIIKTEIDGKLVIGIVFENNKELDAVKSFVNELTPQKIESLLNNADFSKIIDLHLIEPIWKLIHE